MIQRNWPVWVLVLAVCGPAWGAPKRGVLRVAYFIPADRKPLNDYQGRIDRVLTVRKAEHLMKLLSPPQPIAPAAVATATKKIAVSALAMEEAKVGWGDPQRDQVLIERDGGPFIEIGGRFFDTGLYAHAPARYVLRVNRKWKTLNSKYGLQDGHSGSVVFVVVGDGRELFRSGVVKDFKARNLSVSVAGVDVLELRVEDAGDGATNDWGVWAETFLER